MASAPNDEKEKEKLPQNNKHPLPTMNTIVFTRHVDCINKLIHLATYNTERWNLMRNTYTLGNYRGASAASDELFAVLNEYLSRDKSYDVFVKIYEILKKYNLSCILVTDLDEDGPSKISNDEKNENENENENETVANEGSEGKVRIPSIMIEANDEFATLNGKNMEREDINTTNTICKEIEKILQQDLSQKFTNELIEQIISVLHKNQVYRVLYASKERFGSIFNVANEANGMIGMSDINALNVIRGGDNYNGGNGGGSGSSSSNNNRNSNGGFDAAPQPPPPPPPHQPRRRVQPGPLESDNEDEIERYKKLYPIKPHNNNNNNNSNQDKTLPQHRKPPPKQDCTNDLKQLGKKKKTN